MIATGTPVHPDSDPETEDPILGPDVLGQDTAHVQFLPPGTITIVKRVSGGGDGSFDFTGDLDAFTLTTSGGTASQAFPHIQPGTYRVTEVDSDDFSLAQITCDDPGDNSVRDGASAVIRINGSEGMTCTFTNTPTPPTNAAEAVGRAMGKAAGDRQQAAPGADAWPARAGACRDLDRRGARRWAARAVLPAAPEPAAPAARPGDPHAALSRALIAR